MTDNQRKKYFAIKDRMGKLLAEHLSHNDLDFLMEFASFDFWDHAVGHALKLTDPLPLPDSVKGLPSIRMFPAFNPADHEET